MNRLAVVAAILAFGAVPAVSADMPVKARPVVVDTWSWTGFYVGLNGGYSWGRSRSDATFVGPTGVITPTPGVGTITQSNFDLRGGVFGGQAGYNWQTGNWVWGFEADLQWSRERGSTAFVCASIPINTCIPSQLAAAIIPGRLVPSTNVAVDQTIEWFSTFRARGGMLVAPFVYAYVTGGLAVGSVKTDLFITSLSPFTGDPVAGATSDRTTRVGWTVGAGLEAMFARGWTGKLEYLYVDLGSVDSTIALASPPVSANIHSRVTDNVFRAGINYHFDNGPVVARY